MDGVLRRRWFSDILMDLYVWEDEAGDLVRFQLCYKVGAEHAFTWDREDGFTHDRVDDGEGYPGSMRTPILVPNGVVNKPALSALLHGSRNSIEPALYEFLSGKLSEYENNS